MAPKLNMDKIQFICRCTCVGTTEHFFRGGNIRREK